MTYHYHGIDAEESILIKSLPNLGTWALPNLFFVKKIVILVIEFSFQSSVPHTTMKKIHKLLSFSICFSPGRRYVFLGPFVPFRWICTLEIRIPG